MPNKLAILAAALVAFLGMTTPALAQMQETAPEGQYEPAPEATCTPQVAQQVAQATGQEKMTGAPPVAWRPEGEDVVNESFEVSGDGGNGSLCTDTTGVANSGNQEVNQAPACASCGVRVAQAARDALTGGDSDTGTDPADAFGAAINAAHSPGGTEDAASGERLLLRCIE